MQIAVVAAGFTPAEADGLRRAMATFKHKGRLDHYRQKLIEGMVARGYERGFAERCYRQIEGFGYYGFPESHSASFALLAYASAWLKCHHPDVFCAALLNSQPMGFYQPAQLVRDAADHGVEIRPVDVNHSFWDTTLEKLPHRSDRSAVRLGFRQIKGINGKAAERITDARRTAYASPADLQRRAGLDPATMVRLAEADAFRSMALDRRRALWETHALRDGRLPLFATADEGPGTNQPPVELPDEPWAELPAMGMGEQVIEDYRSLRLSLKAHPMGLLRPHLAPRRLVTARDLRSIPPGRRIAIAGLVIIRQRPGSAKGVVFLTLEDETGSANIILWPDMLERYRPLVMRARLIEARGRLQREGRVIHIVADTLTDLTPELRALRDARESAGPHPGDVMPKGRNFH